MNHVRNNKFYIVFKKDYLNGYVIACNYDMFVLTLPEVNYTGANLASSIQDLLNGFAVTFAFEVVYHPAEELSPLMQNLKGWILTINSIHPVILE